MPHRLRPRHPRGRRRLVLVLGPALVALVGSLPGVPVGARTQTPDGMAEFLWGMAGQESGWSYTARNASSGAYGRYQVMPANWPQWAETYLDDRWADQSPHNQEQVVRAKMVDLHRWLGSWRRVAYWWLTGGEQEDEELWSDLARGYVRNVMALMKRAPAGGDPIPPDTSGDGPPAERGDWRLIVDQASMFGGPHEGPRLGRLRDGQVVFVQAARWDDRDVLWMRVSTASEDVGWVSIRRTVPASRPEHADRWPRGGPSDDPGPIEDRRRERARPRPR